MHLSVPERSQAFAVGVAAGDADILELIVGHLQQDQPAAPALEQAPDPARERPDQAHEATDIGSPA
ncbi:hypothetical protein MESS2_330025 [Mesorhizobium metallidurans STM 2683]|uniref:Uncharacterized protein n=1 Tax=Mesorhizobium metallidurans STM 2683 TaxID=1297569 RepID=M5F3X4_9HYPH|nr:hypothetical protein MESS2_330025 [Mesorhizobium metallidurans STM 2683]